MFEEERVVVGFGSIILDRPLQFPHPAGAQVRVKDTAAAPKPQTGISPSSSPPPQKQFDPEDLPALFDEPALSVNRWGAVKVDYSTMETSLPGVYAAGDIVRGASLVVWGIKDGRDAAEAMHQAMKQDARASKVAAE